MSQRLRENCVLSALLVFAALVFSIGITWGLPSRKTDVYLFGNRTPWTGAQILALAPPRASVAADVDANPAARGSIVNDTDAKRAEIVRRYRLFTYQPDEMITMMSLAQMHPSTLDFDPRLYQYGGLWIYPVGALIKLLLHPVADPAYYLDHPEQFAQFYVVARAYSAAWGVAGAWAVYRLIRGCTSRFAAILATLLYTTMPVVVNMAHEAKPHLPGTALMLLAAVAASRYVRRGGYRNLILVSVLCGAAAGMILSAIIAMVIALIAVLLRPPSPCTRGEGRGEGLDSFTAEETQMRREPSPQPSPRVQGEGGRLPAFAMVLAIVAATYFATNPYVLKHLLRDRAVLSANLSNSRAMYRFDPVGGAVRSVQLIAEGAGWPTLVLAIVGIGVLARTKHRSNTDRVDEVARTLPALAPLVACSAIVAFQFAALAAGKPGEYARFALIVDVTLSLVAAVALGGAATRSKWRSAGVVILLLGTTFPSAIYEYGFWSDSRNITRRDRVADQLRELQTTGFLSLAIPDEPAPYLLPPVDLWHWKIELMPRNATLAGTTAQVVARPVDAAWIDPAPRDGFKSIASSEWSDFWPAQISWANKWVQVWQRTGSLK